MSFMGLARRRSRVLVAGAAIFLLASAGTPAQQWVTGTRDPNQRQDEEFAKLYAEWTGEPRFGSPLVDHLPLVEGVPTPKDVLGYHIGAPAKLTYYADILRYYRALDAASPRVHVETIGRSDEDRELVVVWISSDENIRTLQQNRDNLAKIADPRGLSDADVQQLIRTTKPQYHLMGGLHSGETGPSEMLMELAYRLATETSPFISQIRDNVYVSITPVADADGRDRNVDAFYCSEELRAQAAQAAGRGQAGAEAGGRGQAAGGAGGRGGGRGGGPSCPLPYWGKYVYHDNNRDINLSQMQMRAIADWYFTAHPPIMHDLHESLTLLYTYSGGPPQNPNLDPLLFSELPFFSNWEMAQMAKWGMPGVYTHAFMDGWSPGYLGSVAYNHNGMMRMYETQSGRETPPPAPFLVTPGEGRGGEGRGGAAGRGAAGRGEAAGRGGRGGGRGAEAVQTGEGRGTGRGTEAAQGAGGRGAGRGAPAAQAGRGAGGGRGGGGVPTGRGGSQPREWYRGIPVPEGMPANFTRRNNTNYMQTAVLSALQLTSMFPNLVVENFYVKTRNSVRAGLDGPPHAYVIPVQRDMTKPAELVRILKVQGIEVGRLTRETKIGDDTFPAGSYVVKAGQPYWRLAKNLLEKQDYPDPALRTYDDSGWTMGYAFGVEVKDISDKAILDAPVALVADARLRGRVTGSGSAGLAIAHYGSNNMITFRYRLRNVPMKVAEESFDAGGISFPAGSFILTGSAADVDAARAAVVDLGLTAAALPEAPTVPTHDADVPRVAIYSQWSGTQELGWYRHAFDRFGIPYDLIYKERVAAGGLERDYDVIVMAMQNVGRSQVMAEKAAQPVPYLKNDKYKFLGMYGETPDTSGGFGEAGVRAFQQFFEAGGTLIAAGGAVRFPIEFGFARSVDTESVQGLNAQKPLVQAEILRRNHSVFYGYENAIIPVKFGQGQQVFRVGIADQDNVLVQYVGGADSVLSGLADGADGLRARPFAVDIPEAFRGKGRVIMFASNPVYRWQNHGEFNMVFNAILNWNDR
jgi:hypothetical protein